MARFYSKKIFFSNVKATLAYYNAGSWSHSYDAYVASSLAHFENKYIFLDFEKTL
jgi:hypothetical protein